jgi:hypothetical protein
MNARRMWSTTETDAHPRSAGRTARHAGYAVSKSIRKRIAEATGKDDWRAEGPYRLLKRIRRMT